MAADLSPTNPCSTAPITSAINSPKSHRIAFPSPWAQVVRGGEPVTLSAKAPSPSSSSSPEKPAPSDCLSVAPQVDSSTAEEVPLESSDCTSGNASVSKKSAWGRPENGVVGAGPVMGASWPTISESTRPSPKSPSDSPKPISNGSISISQGPVISHAPQKQANNNGNPNFTPKHTQPVRQRSMKRGGGLGGGSGRSGFSRPPVPGPPPPPPLPPPPPPPFPVPFGNLLPPVMELPIREPPYNDNNWETRAVGGVGSHSQAGNDHSSYRHSSRTGNSGSRPRGDGVYHNGYRGRRNQDRDRNASRNSTARDIHMHQMAPRPRAFMRPAIPGSTPFIPPQHVRPFGNPRTFDMVPPFLYGPPLPPDSLRGVPLMAHPLPPAMFFPVMDPNVRTLLVNQIEYYFSDANLVKDNFLRSNMDEQGWVHISLIASFPRVLNLTSNIQLILDTLGASSVVEVQGDKVRRRDDWRKWIPLSGQVPPESGLLSPSESTDKKLATSIQKVSLDEVTTNQHGTMDMEDAYSEVIPGQSEAMINRSKLANDGS